jgi:hypothetical protein
MAELLKLDGVFQKLKKKFQFKNKNLKVKLNQCKELKIN